MVKLEYVNEENWIAVVNLSVTKEQERFLDTPVGIIARGYIYRSCNARVFAIYDDRKVIGVSMVKDMNEEPACYDLQQFMIDKNFQNKGYGTKALNLICSHLQEEGKYRCVEVCVKMNDSQALHVYKKVGFVDTGYIDDDAPDSYNLMYYFEK